MTDEAQSQTTRKRTPKDASEFEREQLRFFLAGGDLSATLASVNPSLAWLPDLVQMKLVEGERQVMGWIERNFASLEAIKDVVDNIAFFGPESAQALEYRLSAQSSSLTPLIADCWRLVIQQMRLAKPLLPQNQWFQIAPRIAQGDRTAALLERIAESLRPRLKLGKRLSLHSIPPDPPEKPSDILSVRFEVDDGASAGDVLGAWPGDEAAENDHRLLLQLTAAMSAALGEATDAGVERNDAFTESDFDVPSVAPHDQNRYRTGFSASVQVTAELWLRLGRKAPEPALDLVQRWRGGQYRLFRRLALFASGDPTVPAQSAAKTLIDTPKAELFLFGSSVEVLRLILARWNEFPPKKRQTILRHLQEGPAQREFREGADVDRAIDGCRFEVLGAMERDGLDIGKKGAELLKRIRARRPDWQMRPPEQAGFHVWTTGANYLRGDDSRFAGIPDAKLVAKAKELAAADFLKGDDWQVLCTSNPDRALRGLDAAARAGDWAPQFWQQLLWVREKYQYADSERRVAELLIEMPAESLEKIGVAVSSWLEAHAVALEDSLLWGLWDRLIDLSSTSVENVSRHDALTEALGSIPGQLAEAALKKLPLQSENPDLFAQAVKRLDQLVGLPGKAGKLGRAPLELEVSYLFDRAPQWTTDKLVPLFDWSCPEAGAAWASRKFSHNIGSPRLFDLTKKPFLELFGRRDLKSDDLETFAEWLTVIVISNRLRSSDPYPITGHEGRAALRRAGVVVLSRVASRFAIEMASVPAEKKAEQWRSIVGPAFDELWPIDVDLQTSQATFRLSRLLLATGDAFPEAADAIIPFIRPEDPRVQTTSFSISQAPDALYATAPSKMLDLVAAVVGEAPAGSVFSLGGVLSKIRAVAPHLAREKKFQRLLTFASL